MYAHVYIVNVPINLISGTHSITEDDLGLAPGTLPPEDLATLGSLWVIPKKSLDLGKSLRARTKRLLTRFGPRVGAGTVVPESSLQELRTGLNEIKTEFYDWKKDFIDSFDDQLDEWVQSHPEYAELIKRFSPDLKRIERRLSYDIDVFRFDVPKDDPNAKTLSATLSRDGNNISKRLKEEIAQFVSESYKGSIQKSGKLVKQNMGPLRQTLLPKIRSFQLLDSSLVPVANHLGSFVDDVSSFIDARSNGSRQIDGTDLQSFEDRMKQLCTVTGIDALIAAAPKTLSMAIPQPEQPSSDEQPTPRVNRPLGSSRPTAPDPARHSTNRPVTF